MFQAIIIGVVILGLLLAAAVCVSRAMRKSETKGPPVDGSGADAPSGDGADAPGGDGD
jgi:hypothetical protein